MNLFSQLVVSLITAGVATAALIQLNISEPLQLGIAIAIACCVTPLLNAVLLGSRSRKRSAGKRRAPKKQKREKQSRKQDDNRDDIDDGPGPDSEDHEEGEVKWFNVSKGFGFIRRENGEEIFVHFREIRNSKSGKRGLSDGQRVSFVVVDSDKGPQAEDVYEI